MLSCFIIRNYKANNASIFETNLPSLASAPSLSSFSNSFAFILFYKKAFEIYNILQKMKYLYICKKSSNQKMFPAVVIMQILNWTNHVGYS